jgi:integrase
VKARRRLARIRSSSSGVRTLAHGSELAEVTNHGDQDSCSDDDKWVDALATLPDVPYKPPKRLRDTFGTLTLLELGLDQIKTVSTLMRHTSEKVTLQHYAKIAQELRLKAARDASGGMPTFAAGSPMLKHGLR